MVVCDVERSFVQGCEGVWAEDLGVREGFEVGCCGGVGGGGGVEGEDFEAGA